MPERLLRRRLYLDFTGRPRNPAGLKPFERDIVPGSHTTRGLNMVDASVLNGHPRAQAAERAPACGD